MKISLNWLRTYLEFNLDREELKDLLTDIGLEVESIEPFQSLKGGLQGLVVGEVLEKAKHPDADKLSVCKVDVGEEVLQIVCGAPNVAAGQKVIVALVGTTLYPTEGEPFQIKKAKIRGVESVGMICAEDEIGTGRSHEGILVLPSDTRVGTAVAGLFGVEDDQVLEIGLTPNRTDAFSHIGVARDLAAALSFRTKKEHHLKVPGKGLSLPDAGNKDNFQIVIRNTAACPRYAGLLISGLKVAESPVWLKNRLKAIGQKPINNVVDITNFILHEFGQPLHAFDLSAISGNKIIVQNLPAKTPFTTLDNNLIELHEEDLMICDGEGKGMCIAGVYGGLHSGVSSASTAIFLECAYFDPKTIRRTSTRHGLRTEAAVHFEKGVDPDATRKVLGRAAAHITEIAGGQIISGVFDIRSKSFEPHSVTLKLDNIRRLTGATINREDVLRILGLLEIRVLADKGDSLDLQVPPYRFDVTREADVIEDILRIYGFNNVPIPARLNASLNFTPAFDPDKLYNKIADTLVDLGFFEMMNNSITRSKYQSALGHKAAENWVNLLSSINAELDVMRNNMLIPGLESVAFNINHKNAQIRLFEFGKTYEKRTPDAITSADGFQEESHLALFLSGNRAMANWKSPLQKSDFYLLKSMVDIVLAKCGIGEREALEPEASEPFEYALQYKAGESVIVEFGKVHPRLAKMMDIKQDVYYADFKWDVVLRLAKKVKISYAEIGRYPSVKRDLALLLDKKIKFSEVKSIAEKYGKKILRNIELFDIYQDEKIGADNKSYAVSFTFRDDAKTLQDLEIDALMKKLMEAYQQSLNAIIR